MKSRGRSALVLSLVALAGVGACTSTPPPTHQALGGDVVARVGSQTIPSSLVASVAHAQNRTPQDALQLLISDALFSESARAKKLDQTTSVARDLNALRAQLVADRIRNDALAMGPCSDAEVDALSKIHLKDVELPERVQVIHAIAIRPKKTEQNADQRTEQAREIGAALEAAVQGATSAEDFEDRARRVPHEGIDVRVESLPAFADDGVVPETGGGMDATFAHAAFMLRSPGDISPVVETSFGWHVIRLNERLSSKDVPREERRKMFAEECVTTRARSSFDALLGARHATTKIEIVQDANDAMTKAAARVIAP
ncbi:MAG: peptidyl-prolyl cis-trans isomerase [Polyangiaceae bacterium]